MSFHVSGRASGERRFEARGQIQLEAAAFEAGMRFEAAMRFVFEAATRQRLRLAALEAASVVLRRRCTRTNSVRGGGI